MKKSKETPKTQPKLEFCQFFLGKNKVLFTGSQQLEELTQELKKDQRLSYIPQTTKGRGDLPQDGGTF